MSCIQFPFQTISPLRTNKDVHSPRRPRNAEGVTRRILGARSLVK